MRTFGSSRKWAQSEIREQFYLKNHISGIVKLGEDLISFLSVANLSVLTLNHCGFWALNIEAEVSGYFSVTCTIFIFSAASAKGRSEDASLTYWFPVSS